jgi:Pyruvate phosphate dikinase, AMP/ATP-binding domain
MAENRQSIGLTSRYGMRTEEFSALMKHRVLEILLVASHYDFFVLEEDGQLTELVIEEYRNLDLNLRYAPRFTRAADAASAFAILEDRKFDMVVTTPRLSDMEVEVFVRLLKKNHPDLPIGLLVAHAWELPWLEELRESGILDWTFLWQGNVQALLAMVKQVEDRLNAEFDILEGGVQAIVLVEDEVRFYSAYLPHIYTQVTSQTSGLMSEVVNMSHRLLRIRARPKILLAQTYEEAWTFYERYSGNLLGVITDLSFPMDGGFDDEAGLKLAEAIRAAGDDVPILIQSMDDRYRDRATTTGADFLSKQSPTLFEELRRYIRDNFGFGDFVFKLPDGQPVGTAGDMRSMLKALAEVPGESLVYHAGRNHFSSWFKARTEFELASMLRPRRVTDFSSPSVLREYLINTLTDYLRAVQRHVVTEFDSKTYDEFAAFSKIGAGSLGGKGRGLAFMHKILSRTGPDLDHVEIAIPKTVVVASEIFEEFLEVNDLRSLVHYADAMSDQEILDAFRNGVFPPGLRPELASFLELVGEPLAVRSSSILEDSVYQPFAGVYATVMLPNNHPSQDVRLAQLLEAVKVVYASTYFGRARDYLETTPHRIEEESMAVLIQRLVGRQHGHRFYPTLSGVASSYNFYPYGEANHDDGVAQIALGLGKSVVEGFEALRFSPKHPHVLPQFSSVKDILRNAQRRFYSLDLNQIDVIPGALTDVNLLHEETLQAVHDGAANSIASTYDRAGDRITTGLDEGGVPLITFKPLLRGSIFPLPEVLTWLIEACQEGMASPVEIEFVANIKNGPGRHQTFNVVQLRPMVIEQSDVVVSLDQNDADTAVVASEAVLGHGRRESIQDIIVVDPEKIDRSLTPAIARIVEGMNRRLRTESRHCILIGPGRWGSRDPWVGIPVEWPQISNARAIVETDFSDLQVEPSLGSHFFHNLSCSGAAFFAVHAERFQGWVNWDWLRRQTSVYEELDGGVRHVRLDSPAKVLVDGSTGHGMIRPP